jgi:DnaK suppressor protein
MEDIKKKLEAELTRTAERIRQMGGSSTSVNTMNALGDTSQLADEVDVIQINEDREMNFATRSLLVERANRLAEALERLRDGEYGICQECEEAIAPARLMAMPEVMTCVRCQDRLERTSRHLAPVGAGFDGDEIEDDD